MLRENTILYKVCTYLMKWNAMMSFNCSSYDWSTTKGQCTLFFILFHKYDISYFLKKKKCHISHSSTVTNNFLSLFLVSRENTYGIHWFACVRLPKVFLLSFCLICTCSLLKPLFLILFPPLKYNYILTKVSIKTKLQFTPF